MDFTIDILVEEAHVLRYIAQSQQVTVEILIERLVRQFVTGQIRGKYKEHFNQMSLNQLETIFGNIRTLFPIEGE